MRAETNTPLLPDWEDAAAFESKADWTGAGAPNAEVDDGCSAPNADDGAAGVDVDAVFPLPNADAGWAPDGWPKTDPLGAGVCAAAVSPKADGCPPANAENAPPPLPPVLPAAAGALVVAEAAGFANAEKPPLVGPVVDPDPKADGLPNEL